jgi:hypothetical protein
MYPIFKEKSNYPDFLHIRMACSTNESEQVEFCCCTLIKKDFNRSYCKFRIDQNLSDTIPVEDDLKGGND